MDETPAAAPESADARPATAERGRSGEGNLLVPLVVMLAIAGLVGGMAYWKLAFDERELDLTTTTVASAAPAPEPPPAEAEHVVVVKDMKFTPDEVTIAVGDAVTWQFDDAGTLHSVAGLSDFAMIINSAYMRTGVYTVTFDRPGVYRYIDGVNPQMTGTVTVE